jgi:hypothetical protein
VCAWVKEGLVVLFRNDQATGEGSPVVLGAEAGARFVCCALCSAWREVAVLDLLPVPSTAH